MCNLKGLHHDPAVYGEDANEFRPERFLDGGWEKLPSNAWKPFGTGARACIGRALAEQELLITCALIFQRFVVEMADPNYELRIKQTLTIKPQDFRFKVRRRPGKDRSKSLQPSVEVFHRSRAKQGIYSGRYCWSTTCFGISFYKPGDEHPSSNHGEQR